MKTFRIFFAVSLAALLFTGISGTNSAYAQPGVTVSFQSFYASLSPYGRWTNNPQYGSVWIPNVNVDFHPYQTNGRWVMTDYGNTWVSDYDWGWAPFHYGRWFLDDYYGWIWVPGYEWGPGWVNWRTGGGYYGWAPLGPGLQVNIAVDIPMGWWCFVPQVYFSNPGWYNYRLARTRVVNVYHQTTIINNYYRNDNRVYAYGPRRADIERVTRNSVPVYQYSRNNNREVIRESGPRNGRTSDYNTPGNRNGSNRNDNEGYGSRGDNGNNNRGDDNPRDYNGSRRGTYSTPTTPERGNARVSEGTTASPRNENTAPDYGSSRGRGNTSTTETPNYPGRSAEQPRSSGGYSDRGNDRGTLAPRQQPSSPSSDQGTRRGGYEGSRGGSSASPQQRQSPSSPSIQNRGGAERGGNSSRQSNQGQSQSRGGRGGN